MKTLVAAGALALALAAPQAVRPASAQTGAPPLDPALERQLERWLGAGDLTLSNLYTRRPGDDSRDFHAAADERGPTFTLLRVSDRGGNAWLVGGYNPQSWSPDDGWHITERDFRRTAFIFNYTDATVYRQVPSSFELPSQGAYQTFNALEQGPTFGAGPDLLVNDRLDTALSWRLSYGDPAGAGQSIVNGSRGGQFFAIDALELYAVSPIPEPAAAALLAGGLGLVALARRRSRPAAPRPGRTAPGRA